MESIIFGVITTCLVLLEVKQIDADQGRVYMVTSPETMAMPINDEAILTCEMNLKPDRFEWRHYPLHIHDASNPKYLEPLGTAHSVNLPYNMFTTEKKTSTLRIKFTNKTVAGDYQCLAHYGASVVASIPGRITVTTLEKFLPHSNTDVTVTTGNTVLWRCDPPQSNPPALIDYYKNNNYYVTPKITQVQTRSLILPNVDVSASGVYNCKASNIIEQSTQQSNYNLNLKVVKNGPVQAPRFIIPPNKLYVGTTGETVFLECSVVGTPVPKVYWLKQNGELPSNRTELVPGGLILKNLRSTDDGVYICNHSNSAGTISHHITLMYNEPPSIFDGPKNTDIKEGENLDLECSIKGTPEPQISWFLNGRSVANDSLVEAIGNRIYFRPIEKRHAGTLQCFASNVAGTTYSSANLKVIPKQLSSTDVLDDYLIPHPTPSNHIRKKHKSKFSRHRYTNEMIPPSRPTVTRLSDESVMVRWTVPENQGLPISFFKVQYRELGPINHNGTHKGSKWRTTNADIDSHIRSFEVNNLKPDHAYRFRIAAVYSNNDNKLGPNSAKFLLNRADFFARNPLPVPRLVHTETVNETSIKIYWEYPVTENISIDGVFVHYLPIDSASDYMKATVEGENVRSYIINHLQPGTIYDIKLQSFTIKSASEFSPIMKETTSANVKKFMPKSKEDFFVVTDLPVSATTSPSTKSSGQTEMYIIIGAGVGGVALLLSIIVFLILWRRKIHKKQPGDGPKEDGGHHIQVDANDYVVSPKTLSRVNGCASTTNRITITPNPLADADNKNQNMIEMSCLSSQNNNCSQPSASTQEALPTNSINKRNKIKNKENLKRNKQNNVDTTCGENYV